MPLNNYAENTLGNSNSSFYPLTKMNFIVTVSDGSSTNTARAAFSEVTGVEATVDVIEFRQGNSESLSPVKVPGLVKHGNVTLKFGYTLNNGFKEWVTKCVSSTREGLYRADVTIELIDTTTQKSPTTLGVTTASGAKNAWILKNAWVTKYTAPDLNAMQSEIAMESVEIVYETLVIPNGAGAATGAAVTTGA